MIRFSTFLLCFALFVAATGRYKAETAVRVVEDEIAALEAQRRAEEREIQILRAELALLESPDRIAELARTHTDLGPVSGKQMMSADDFLLAFGGDPAARAANAAASEDNDQPSDAARVAQARANGSRVNAEAATE
ncbi:MAG: hypothetical protein AAF224_14190 [Pseudomonadota bacterium]